MSRLVDRKLMDVLRVEYDAQPYLPTLTNHSGQTFNTAEWTPDPGASITALVNPSSARLTNPYVQQGTAPVPPSTALQAETAASGTNFIRLPEFEVTPGNVVALSLDAVYQTPLGSGVKMTVRMGWIWVYSDGSSATGTGYYDLDSSNKTAQTITRSSTVPADAVRARPVVTGIRRRVSDDSIVTGESTFWNLCRVRAIQAPTAALAAANRDFREADWSNVLGSTVSVRAERGGKQDGVVAEIDTGTCTVMVRDAALDPARGSFLRRGRAFRVTAEDSSATRRALFTGRISVADVDYSEVIGSKIVGAQPARPEQITRTNLAPNPSFEVNVTTGVISGSATTVDAGGGASIGVGSRGAILTISGATASTGYIAERFTMPSSAARGWLGFSALVRRSTGATHMRLLVQAENTDAGTTESLYSPYFPLNNAAITSNRFAAAVQVPAGTNRATCWVRFHGSDTGGAPQDGTVFTDAWMACPARTEAAALDAVGAGSQPYFDGDSAARGELVTRWTAAVGLSASEEYLPFIAAVPGTPTGKPRVTVTAVDAIEQGRRLPSPYTYYGSGVGVKQQLAANLMAPHPLPWRFLGYNTYPVPTTTPVTVTRDDATLWDQLLLIRNQVGHDGKLFCDVDGRITYGALNPGSVTYLLDDEQREPGAGYRGAPASFKAADTEFGPQSLVNQLLIRSLTGDKTLGPYQARTWAREYGVVPAELELVHAAGANDAQVRATDLFTAYSQPRVLPASITFDALEERAWAQQLAWAEVHERARIILRAPGIDRTVGIIGITHEIVAHRNRPGGRWETTLRFRDENDVSDNAPQVVNVNAPEAGDSGLSPTDVEPNYGPLGVGTLTANQAISAGSLQSVAFSPQLWGGVSYSSTDRRFSVPRRGRYQIDGAITWTTITSPVLLSLLVNGAARFSSRGGGAGGSQSISLVLTLAANDTVGLAVRQDASGPTRQLDGSDAVTFLTLTYLGD